MNTSSDIFPFGKNPDRLSAETLQAYLEGRLSTEQQHEVEKWLGEEGLEGDAIEGLRSLNAADVKQTVRHLDYKLSKQLNEKKKKRRYYHDNKWVWVAIILTLLCCILGYLLIHFTVRA